MRKMSSNFSALFSILVSLSVLTSPINGELKGYPIIFVPGDGGSQIEARIDKPAVVHYICSKKTDYWFSLWLNLELLVPIVIDCWVDNMKLYYDNNTRTTTNSPGVDIRIPGFGNSTPVEWLDPSKASAGNYFASIADSILNLGYQRDVTMRGAPYDFRKAPNENKQFFVDMKTLVEETYRNANNTKVVLITHSMGSPMILHFLNRQTQAWKDQFIQSWVSLAGCWGGTVKAVKVFAEGDDLGVRVLSQSTLREEQRTSPSLAWLLPYSKLWSQEEVLVQTAEKNYTLSNLYDFFQDIDFPTGHDMWLDTRDLNAELKAPGVELHCLHGVNVDTIESVVYAGKTPAGKSVFKMGDGDGTVNVRSLAACSRWSSEQSQPVYTHTFPKRDHMAVLTDTEILTYIRNVVTIS